MNTNNSTNFSCTPKAVGKYRYTIKFTEGFCSKVATEQRTITVNFQRRVWNFWVSSSSTFSQSRVRTGTQGIFRWEGGQCTSSADAAGDSCRCQCRSQAVVCERGMRAALFDAAMQAQINCSLAMANARTQAETAAAAAGRPSEWRWSSWTPAQQPTNQTYINSVISSNGGPGKVRNINVSTGDWVDVSSALDITCNTTPVTIDSGVVSAAPRAESPIAVSVAAAAAAQVRCSTQNAAAVGATNLYEATGLKSIPNIPKMVKN